MNKSLSYLHSIYTQNYDCLVAIVVLIMFCISGTSHANSLCISSSKESCYPAELRKHFQIQFEGAFRVTAKGDSVSDYAIGTLAYNPSNNSIFVAGHDHHGAVAEFAIPKKLSINVPVSKIVEAKVLQEYVSILDKKQRGQDTNRITGMLYYDGNLLVNSEIWYDAPASNQDNLQVFTDANNLKESSFKGLLQLQGRALAAGYMSKIPLEWQAKFGGAYFTGWASNYSITSRYSQGPSVFVFNPQQAVDLNMNESLTVNTIEKMAFPLQFGTTLVPDGDKYPDKISPLWGPLASVRYAFIIPGSNILMAVGSHAGIDHGAGYKIRQDNGNICGGGCTKVVSDQHNYFWLFKVDDILNAPRPHLPRPFSYGKWSHPYDNKGQHHVLGATYDSINKRLLISLKEAGRTDQYGRPPLIISYKISPKS